MKNQTKEKKAYQAVIFDLDGTLLNTLEDLKDSVNYALRMYHKKERSLEEVRNFVGNGVEKLVQRALMPDQDEKTFTEVFAVFKAYYEEHCNDKTCLYPGIAELLTSLQKKGIKTAISGSKIAITKPIICPVDTIVSSFSVSLSFVRIQHEFS